MTNTSTAIDLASRLDADHLAVLEMLPAGLLDLNDIEQTRSNLTALFAAMPAPEPPSDVAIEDHTVPGLDDDPALMVRTYRPESASSGSPALYYIHGGGMVLGSVDMNDADCASWASDLGIPVASVEYRLAPENPHPAPVRDCYAGLSWFAERADDLGVDPARIAIGGASAGGGLAAGLALMARDRGGPTIAFQLLVYPMLDHRNNTPSSGRIVDDRVWNHAANEAAWAAYLGGGEPDIYASPALADDLSGLPPAYINVGDLDLFVDEDIAYAQALQRAGVPAELHVYPGAFHGSNSFVADSPLTKRWGAEERDTLRRALLD